MRSSFANTPLKRIIHTFTPHSYCIPMRYFVLYLVCALVLSSKSTLAQDNSWSITLSKEAIVSQDQGIPRILFAEQRAECYFVLREQIYRNFKRRKFFIERLDFALKSLQTKDITEQLDEQNF